MALESDLIAELKVLCPRVHIGAAPYGTVMPYVTWQHIGGESLRYTDNTAADKRKPLIQLNVWDTPALSAFALIQRIVERLCLAEAFQAEPLGEPILAHDDADIATGYLLTFSILGDR